MFPVVCRAGAPPSRFLWFLAALLCERRVTRFLARAPFGFCLSAFILFVVACFPLFASVLPCLRYFVVVNGGLCPFICQGFLFHLVDLLGVFLCVSRMW